MIVFIAIVIILICGLVGFLFFAMFAGAAATKSAFDQAIDDREQEAWIREYMEEKEQKKTEKASRRNKMHK